VIRPGVDELFEVVGHGGLAQADGGGEVADAGLGVGMGGDEGHQPDPGWVAEGLKDAGQTLASAGSRTPPVTGLQQAATSSTKGTTAAGVLPV